MKSFSEFCTELGCPLKNSRWSWAAISPDKKRVVFTLWEDEIEGDKYVLYPVDKRRERPRPRPANVNDRLGAKETLEIAMVAATTPGIDIFGVHIRVKNADADTRERRDHIDHWLYRLKIESDGERYVARISGKILTTEI